MERKKFQFTQINQIEEVTFDKSLEKFYGNGIEGTIKENLQNSLDARLDGDFDKPVNVTIKLSKVPKSELPGIDEVFKHINSLRGYSNYTKETVSYMKGKINMNKVPVLTIEDENTKGLTGAKNGQSGSIKDTFGIYAYKKGVHSIDENDSMEISRGGSHGIGKIANNAASDINLMYFANCDAEQNQHLGGTVHLIEHELENVGYRSTGYFSDVKETENYKLVPFENYYSHSIFRKKTRGLKIIIPYIREEFYDVNAIVRAICDNFFLALLNENIVVNVIDEEDKEIIINSETIKDIVKDSDYYETKIEEMKKIFTPLYIHTFINKEPKDLVVKNNIEEFNFKLYFNYDENISVGRVALLRTIGMKIVDLKVLSRVRKPFNAVLVGGSKEDSYLKTLENESHTDISENDIRDHNEKKNAKKFISNLQKELKKEIDKIMEENNPTDGFINTEDLFYETESSFKKDIESSTEKVIVGEGKTLFKAKYKEKREPGENSGGGSDKDKVRIRKPRKIKNDPESHTDEYITPLNAVERMSINEEEFVNINIIEAGLDENIDKCNVIIKVIDGNGETVAEDFNVQENYKTVLDQQLYTSVPIYKNKIEDVKVKDGIIKLKLLKKEDRSNKLKFMYVLEVKK